MKMIAAAQGFVLHIATERLYASQQRKGIVLHNVAICASHPCKVSSCTRTGPRVFANATLTLPPRDVAAIQGLDLSTEDGLKRKRDSMRKNKTENKTRH